MFVYMSYLLALSTLSNWVTSQEYYWRPYNNGEIPTDALLVSTYGSIEFYIGRAPLSGVGLLVGEIYGATPNVTVCDGQMSTPDGPTHEISDYAEIFCTGHPLSFGWYTVNASTLHQIPYQLIPGGYEGPNIGTLYIGRHIWRTSPPPAPYYYRIGKVAGYNYNSSDVMYISDGENTQDALNSYEVLVWIERT